MRRIHTPKRRYSHADPYLHDRERAAHAELMERLNAIGVFIGARQPGVRREPAVICCIDKGRDPKEVQIPPTVQWPTVFGDRDLPTEVRAFEEGGYHSLAVGGPGDTLTYQASYGPAPSSGGMAINHPVYGTVLTTAAHTFLDDSQSQNVPGDAGPPVTLQVNVGVTVPSPVTATMLAAFRQPKFDYALLRLESAVPSNAYQSNAGLISDFTGTYTPTCADLHTVVFALRPGGQAQTSVIGVRATLPIGGMNYQQVTLTPRVTVPGDSGCPLVDSTACVWGLLVGWVWIDVLGQCSAWLSPDAVLANERCGLA